MPTACCFLCGIECCLGVCFLIAIAHSRPKGISLIAAANIFTHCKIIGERCALLQIGNLYVTLMV